jgi:hypothetical protein
MGAEFAEIHERVLIIASMATHFEYWVAGLMA